jgi:hypothetical protein
MHGDARLYAAELLAAQSLDRRTWHRPHIWRAPRTAAST